MPTLLSLEFPGYAVLQAASANDEWNGALFTLEADTSVTIPTTPNGSTIFTYENITTLNNAGSLMLVSGATSLPLPAPAGQHQLLAYIYNWKGNSLKITNTSGSPNTPINIQLMGPGMPGALPAKLPVGQSISLAPGGAAQGVALPRWMQLALENTSGDTSIIAIIGGPTDSSGNNAYLIGLNWDCSTGPPTTTPPPAGYYATSRSTNYSFQFKWGSASVYCANFSGSTAEPASVTLRSL